MLAPKPVQPADTPGYFSAHLDWWSQLSLAHVPLEPHVSIFVVSVRHLVLASPDGSCATTATDNIYRCNTHSTSPRQRLSGYISVHVLTQSPQECLCDEIPLLRHLHNSASAKISRQERVRARDLCVCVSSPARVFLRYTAAASTGFA